MSETGRKRLVEIAIDEDLLALAQEAGTDLSEAAEAGIRRLLPVSQSGSSEARKRAWQNENADAINEFNDYVATNGLPWLATDCSDGKV